MAHALERKLCWKKSGGRSERSGPRSGHLAARQVMVFWARTLGRRFENPGLFFFSVRRRAGEPVRPGAGGPDLDASRTAGRQLFLSRPGLARLRARASDVRERRAQPTARSSFRANDDHRRTRAGRPAGILPAPAGEGARSSATRRVRAAVGATENVPPDAGARGTKREEGEENASRRRGDAAAAPPETRASADRAPLSVRRRPRASRDPSPRPRTPAFVPLSSKRAHPKSPTAPPPPPTRRERPVRERRRADENARARELARGGPAPPRGGGVRARGRREPPGPRPRRRARIQIHRVTLPLRGFLRRARARRDLPPFPPPPRSTPPRATTPTSTPTTPRRRR